LACSANSRVVGPAFAVTADGSALVDRDDVEVQMEHRLSGRRLVELHDPDAVRPQRRLRRPPAAVHRDGGGQRRRIGVEQVARRAFGMTSRCPFDCGKMSMIASTCVVLEHLVAGISPADHLAKRLSGS
jgi:hypothetical protein